MKNKVTFLKEKQLEKKAQKNFEFIKNTYVQNPIENKFLAFQKTKKNITLNDLL